MDFYEFCDVIQAKQGEFDVFADFKLTPPSGGEPQRFGLVADAFLAEMQQRNIVFVMYLYVDADGNPGTEDHTDEHVTKWHFISVPITPQPPRKRKQN